MTPAVEALVATGDAALEAGDAAAARAAFEEAVAAEACGRTLEGLARAHQMALDYVGAREVFGRAYSAFRDERDAVGAYRAARMIAMFHGGMEGEWALYHGWINRAATLLEEVGGELERGRLELIKGRYGDAPVDKKEAHFREGLAIGRRLGDAVLEVQSLAYLGGTLVEHDRVTDGMPMLDEALTAVCAGEVRDPSVVDEIFCILLAACEQAHDVARAEQWMRAMRDMAERRNLVSMAALCRAHYGGLLTAAGRWAEAEQELVTSSKLFDVSVPHMSANAAARLAYLRVRQGRLDDAAALLKGLDENPDAARGLAALHLARGDAELARDRLERAMSQASSAGVTGPLLALLVDVHLAAGDHREADAAAERLAELAIENPTNYLKACAALAQGKVCVATTSGDARACLLDALAAFARAEMPVDVARARLELARAVAVHSPEVAVAEASAALDAFELVAAAREVDETAALLRSLGRPGRSAAARAASVSSLTRREGEVLELLGHGLTNAEIGDRLYISKKTVEHHVGRVLAKLGLRSRAEAAAHAARTESPK